MSLNVLSPTVRDNLDAIVGGLDDLDADIVVTEQYRQHNRHVVEIETDTQIRLTRNGMSVQLNELTPTESGLHISVRLETMEGEVEFKFDMSA